jgi:hypothetical protein
VSDVINAGKLHGIRYLGLRGNNISEAGIKRMTFLPSSLSFVYEGYSSQSILICLLVNNTNVLCLQEAKSCRRAYKATVYSAFGFRDWIWGTIVFEKAAALACCWTMLMQSRSVCWTSCAWVEASYSRGKCWLERLLLLVAVHYIKS